MGHPTQGQPQHGILSSSGAGEAQDAFPFQRVFEDVGRLAIPQITCEQNSSLNGPPSQPMGADDEPRCVPQNDDDSESSTVHLAKLVASDASSEKEVA